MKLRLDFRWMVLKSDHAKKPQTHKFRNGIPTLNCNNHFTRTYFPELDDCCFSKASIFFDKLSIVFCCS